MIIESLLEIWGWVVPNASRFDWLLPRELKRRRAYRRDLQRIEEQIEQAREQGDRDWVRALQDQKGHVEMAHWEEEQLQTTRQLMAERRKFNLPSPPRTDDENADTGYWQRSRVTGDRYLTSDGVQRMKEILREEKQWHMRRREHWTKLIGQGATALTGLIGALIGLVTILQ